MSAADQLFIHETRYRARCEASQRDSAGSSFFFHYLAAIRLRRLRGAFERVLPCGIASRELGLELVEYSKAGERPWIASRRSRKQAKRCSSAA